MDHVSAGSGVSDFDTTSSVIGGTFESNISLVDPAIQFSRTEKRLVEWGVSFTAVMRHAGVDRARSSGRSGSEFGRMWLQRAGRCADSSFVSGI